MQHRLASNTVLCLLARHLHLLYHQAATASGVTLVRWSQSSEPGGGKQRRRRSYFCPKSYVIKRRRALTGRWLPQSHPLSGNVKHTCRHGYMCANILFSLSFSVSLQHTHRHTHTHTLVLCRTDEPKLMLDQCLVQEADLAA